MSNLYRIREVRAEICNGFSCYRDKRFQAERQINFFGLKFWWPVGERPHVYAEQAEIDIKNDRRLRAPLKSPFYYRYEE